VAYGAGGSDALGELLANDQEGEMMNDCTCGQTSHYVWAHDDHCPVWTERGNEWRIL
jgi:hypothetical protein